MPNVRAETDEPLDRILADEMATLLDCHEPWFHATVAAVSAALREGHTCLYLPRWASHQPHEQSDFIFPDLDDWLERLACLPITVQDDAPLVLDRQRLYLRRYWRFESELGAELRARLGGMSAAESGIDYEQACSVLELLFPDQGAPAEPAQPPEPPSTKPIDWQKLAAANALWQRVSIIAGGPGTGKTHTVTRLLALLIELTVSNSQYVDNSPTEDPRDYPAQDTRYPRIHLTAPTGKAAQRLAEAVAQARAGLNGLVSTATLELIPQQATTLHRLLGVRADDNGFRHNRDNQLNLDLLVVDEISMVDLPLMARLFRALPSSCRIILLGDADQLPSVAAGSVLADLVIRPHPGYSQERLNALTRLGVTVPPPANSAYHSGSDGAVEKGAAGGADHVSFLYASQRFAGGGGIGQLAEQVIAGQVSGSLEVLRGNHEDLEWLSEQERDKAIGVWIEQHYSPILQAGDLDEAFRRLAVFRILCPMRGGPDGVQAINERVLRVVNPQQRRFFHGLPLMITRNCYRLGLYNGDVGLIWPDETGQLLAWFPGSERYHPIAPARLPEHETVYAMTIHKTQGSEFTQVALLLPHQPTPIITRELLYTGLTRAREHLIISAATRTWEAGVRAHVERHSGLAERLR